MTDADRIAMIRNICHHPGSFHWSGRQMADAIMKVLDQDKPIPYALSDLDHPVPYELAHDAVFEELDS